MKTQKQRIFSILAILIMAVILTCIFASCNKVDAQESNGISISFNSMGGSSVQAITIEKGKTISLPTAPTKEGYVFDGWYYDENYSTAYKVSDTFTSNTTLYAKWNENKKQFTNIVFNDQTFSYDGTPHSLSISGYPEGTDVSFDIPNSQTLVGVYKITATLSKVGYETKTYSATMTIDKGIIDTSKFVFEDKEFQQDGTPKSLKLIGDLPYGVTVEYINNNQTLDGVYTVTAHFVYDKNLYYEVSDMTATMTIVTPLVSYNIHYELNKGVNSGKNPSTYLSPNENEIKLYPATRSAWIFDGWYRNENFEGSAITELPKNTSGDIYLYAKWVKPYIIAADDLFTINDKTITATVGHDVSIYSFIESFNACSDCTWSLYSDYLGTNELVLKNMQLNYGMNTAYIVVWSEDRSAFTQYTLNVYRLSMRNYSYSILGRTVDAGQIEEQSALNAPDDPDVQHYIFGGWYVGDQQISFPYTVHVDTVITAKMTPIEYDLTYVLNGGTNDDSNPTTYNVENISTLMSRLQKATKDYYDFIQWSLSLEDIAKIESGELGSLTLNADFTPTVYNLTFHKDGGNYTSEYKKWKSLFIDVDMAQWENCYEEWLTEKGLSAVLDKMKECNLTFSDIELAWQLVESGKEIDEVVWQPLSEEEARNAWASRVLSVVYSEFNATTPCEPEIFVLYYEFFGLCESPDAYEMTYTVESNDILFESIHKNGYKFVGWYDNAEFNGEPITLISAGSHGNVELYAKWEQVTFNFVYELDGGVNDAANPLTFTIDTFIDDIANLRSSSKDYYNFKSWTCGPEDSAVEAWEADGNASLCTYSDNYCLTAKYTPIDYSITFNLGGGNLAETPVSKYNIETADITLPIPSRTGYTFVGWFDNDQLSGEAIDCIPLGSHDDKVFYAKWQTIDYAITYDLNDANSVSPATNSTSNPATYTIEDTVVFADPTRAGYKFTGWSISNINVGTYGEKTITANWQIINYDITYDLNDSNSVSLATNNGTNPSTYTIEENVTFAAPTRTGYDFTGWTLSSIVQGSTGAVSTTATWEIINYSITYDFAIAESSKSQVVDNSANTVFSYTIEDEVSFNAPTRAGYTFVSWDVPTIAKGTYGNKTIVASWNIVDYSITYNLNGGTNHSENPLSFNVEQLPITLKDADSEDDVFNSWRSINSIDGDKIIQITTIGDKIVYALFGGTEGLQYSLSSDGTYYSVSGYTGTLTDVVVGKRYNNKPVTAISREAFKNNTNIVSIKLSNTINGIGDYAFDGCTGLTSIYYTGDVASWCGISGLGNLMSSSRILYIGGNKVEGELIIPDSVTSIGDYAFSGCAGLTSVTIPDSVTSIGDGAFYNCYRLIEVYNKSTLSITAGSSSNGYVALYAKNVYTNEGGSKLTTDENGYVIYTDGDEKILVAYHGTNTELALPSYITKIYQYAFYNCKGLTSITIPDSVTSIGDFAFYNCTGLTSVTIPDSVTSIGDFAFYNCTSLTTVNWNAIACTSAGSSSYPIFKGCSNLATVNIGDNVKIIPSDAFYGCTGLTTVYWNATACTSAGSWNHPIFYNCSNLVTVNIGDNVKIIPSYVFYNCTGLTNITIPDSVTSVGERAFLGCTGLTSVTIGNSVTSIGIYAFEDCTGLTTVNWNATACTSAGSYNSPIFKGCSNLATVNIGDNVKIIPSHAFYGCTGLTSVTIPDSVTSIGSSAFEDCTGLTSVTIPNSVTSIGSYAFAFCNGLTTVNWNATACTSAGSSSYPIFKGCSNLATVNIGDNVKIIPSYAFEDCTGLTSVTIPDSVTSIGSDAFIGCTGLTSVTIGSGVTSIDNFAFTGCTGLTSVTIGGSVTSIGWSAFSSCTGLTSVTIGSGVTSINDSAFDGCTGLTTVNWNATACTRAGSSGYPIFEYCSNLTTVNIGDNVKIIPSYAFYGCYKLIEVYNKSSLTITAGSSDNGYVAYYAKNVYTNEGGSKLTEDENGYIIYTDGDKKILVTYLGTNTELILPSYITEINQYAFYNCNGLTSVTIPDSVTSIGDNAFAGCTGLTSVTIGNSVTSIGDNAFDGCTGLTSVTIPDSVTSIGERALYNTLWYNNQPDGLVYAGKVAYKYKGTMPSNTSIVLEEGTLGIAGSAFRNCTGLTSITIPDSVTSIGEESFDGCNGLTSVTIGGSVTSIGDGAFYNCYRLIEVYNKSALSITAGSYSNGRVAYYAKNVYTNEGESKLTTDENGYVIYTDEDEKILVAYHGTNTELALPSYITKINQYAFRNCTGLTSITIPDSVTSIGDDAFEGCTGLTSVTIPDSVTSIGTWAFEGCNNLQDIYITDIGAWCNIAGLSRLMSYGASNKNFYIKNELATSITIPNGVKAIPAAAFSGCTGLTSVTIGGSVTSIGDGAFYNCYRLIEVYNKSTLSITAGSSSNGYVALYAKNVYTNEGGSKLTTDENGYVIYTDGDEKILVAYHGTNTELALPSYITKIYQYAFYNCKGLTSVTIGNGVTSIGSYAFYNCTGLKTVFYAGTEEQWKAVSIGSDNGSLTRATRVYNYDGVERTYSFVTNCEQSVDSVTATYLSTLPTVAKEGHHFCGWYDNVEFAGNSIAAPYCSKDKTTLYAKWLTEEEWLALLDGTSFEKAYIAESGKTYDVNVTTGGQIVYFAFNPTTSGSFTIQSIGSGDTYGTLYSASQSSLTTDDDGGDGNNFKITYTMTVGTTYYVAVKFYGSSTTGTFKVSFS